MSINNVDIQQIIYKDQPVVTFQMIAEVHSISVENVYKSFKRHEGRFTLGKHFYLVEKAELDLESSGTLSTIHLFTMKGYRLLTKPMRDERSWQVQEQMIDDYFALREQVSQGPSLLETTERQIRILTIGMELMDRLGGYSDRERLFYKGLLGRLMTQSAGAQQPLALPPPAMASVSDRLYTIRGDLPPKTHTAIAQAAGRVCAKVYREK